MKAIDIKPAVTSAMALPGRAGTSDTLTRSRTAANMTSTIENPTAAPEPVQSRFNEFVALLNVQQRHTQYRAVGGDQREENTQYLVRIGLVLCMTISVN